MIIMELEKIWKKRSFLCLCLILIIVQVFLLWYNGVQKNTGIPLSGYKKLSHTLAGMTEEEKQTFLAEEKKLLDGMQFVEKSIMYQEQNTELGEAYQEMVLSKNMDYYNQYYSTYQAGGYLKFCDNLEQEAKLIEQAKEACHKTAQYKEYIQNLGKDTETLGQISLFDGNKNDGFSKKNMKKSAEDHAGLEEIETCYDPSVGVERLIQFSETDLLAILFILYFAIGLVWEEKQRGLFAVTRATERGRFWHILQKTAALFIQSVVTTVILWGIRLLWFGVTTGYGDIGRSIQSSLLFMESSFRWSMWVLCVVVLLTKALAVFAAGELMLLCSMAANHAWVPWLFGVGIFILQFVLYKATPLHSVMVPLKYMNVAALMDSGGLFGGYFNLPLFGSAVSRVTLCLTWNILAAVVLTAGGIVYFLHGFTGRIQAGKRAGRRKRFGGNSLFWQEAAKIFGMNKAAYVILAFLIFMGAMQITTHYAMPLSEKYYKELMLSLQGAMTPKKEALIQKEQEKYDNAFAEIERIERLEAEGSIDESAAALVKQKQKAVVMLYPAFERVLAQYERVKKDGTQFLYDTGYAQLFWLSDDAASGMIKEFFITVLFLIAAFGGVLTMETERSAWMLIGTTETGMAQIKKTKGKICLSATAGMTVFTWGMRFYSINASYPMEKLTDKMGEIAGYTEKATGIPILRLPVENLPLAAGMIGQILLLIVLQGVVTAFILILSEKCRRTLEVYGVASVLLLLPAGVLLLQI